MLKLTILGAPVIQQRPRMGKYRNFYDPSSKERKELTSKMLTGRQGRGLFAPYVGDLSVKVAFHYLAHGKRKMDLDNMIKACLDSGNGILWEDDSNIQHLDIWKYRCDEISQRTEIEIMKL